jgi:hypothetical protein
LQLLKPLAGSSISLPSHMTTIVTSEKAQLLDVIDRLTNSLMDVSDIFNLAATPYHLFALALQIIQFSELNDPKRVAALWRSLIYR